MDNSSSNFIRMNVYFYINWEIYYYGDVFMEIDIDNNLNKEKLVVGGKTIKKNIEEGDDRGDVSSTLQSSFIDNSSIITDNEYEVTNEIDYCNDELISSKGKEDFD